MNYHYQATNNKGEIIHGQIEAGDEASVLAALHKQRLIPLKINKASRFAFKRGGSGKKVKYRTVSIFTMEMSTLLEAGLPLDRSLTILVNMEENPAWKQVLDALLTSVKSGKSLADSMQKHEQIFSRFYISLIAAGELSGSLNVVLERLSEHMERTLEIRAAISKAMIYPIILVVVGTGVLIYLLSSVVPKFEPMIAASKGDLPFLSDMIFWASRMLRNYWFVLLGMAVLTVLFMRNWFASSRNRARLDVWLLRNGFTKNLVKNMELSRLSRTLGTMLTYGVPLVVALRSVKESVSNSVLREVVDESLDSLKNGRGMAQVLITSKQFPTLGVQMIRVGEETGKLEKMLLKVADIYDKEFKNAIDRFVGILSPAAILLIAAMVALIMVGLIMAIYSLKI